MPDNTLKFLPNFSDFSIEKLEAAREEIDFWIKKKSVDRDEKPLKEFLAYAQLAQDEKLLDMEIIFSFTERCESYASITIRELLQEYNYEDTVLNNVFEAVANNDIEYEREYTSSEDNNYTLEITDREDRSPIPKDLRDSWKNNPWGISWRIG